jgi:hypothetical protein
MATLKSVMDKHFSHIKYDKAFAKSIYQFQVNYLNSSSEYLDFYSSNLLGVHRVRFKASDTDRFIYDVLGVDGDQLDRDLDHVPSVKKINSVTSDILNISCVYLIHMFMHSNDLNEHDRQKACYDIATIFFMRAFAALISSYFTYPADERIVKVAYSNLSGNSLIKKLGNWFKVADYRSKSMLDKHGIHYRTLNGFLEEKVDYVISDNKDRIKDTIKNYYREIVKVRDSGDMIGGVNSLAMNAEGEIGLVDKINSIANSTMVIKTLITNNNFIKEDLLYLIWSVNKNTTIKSIREILVWVNENYITDTNNKLINSLLEDITKYTYYLVNNKVRKSKRSDVSALLIELKNLYLSTRNEDRDLIGIRDITGEVINKAKKKNIGKSLFLATRTAVILYISMLVLTN